MYFYASLSQVFSVPPKVWAIRSYAQSHTHRIPVHHYCQIQNLQAQVDPEEQPQRIFRQLPQLCHLLSRRQTQPSGPGTVLLLSLTVYVLLHILLEIIPVNNLSAHRDVCTVRTEDLRHHGPAGGPEGEAAAHRAAPG